MPMSPRKKDKIKAILDARTAMMDKIKGMSGYDRPKNPSGYKKPGSLSGKK